MPLAGKTVLVVEDDYYLAEMLQDALVEAGANVLGPAPTVDLALSLLSTSEHPPSSATLNFNLAGETSLPVADELHRLNIPFVFLTGADDLALGSPHGARPIVHKPFTVAKVVRAILLSIEAAQ